MIHLCLPCADNTEEAQVNCISQILQINQMTNYLQFAYFYLFNIHLWLLFYCY